MRSENDFTVCSWTYFDGDLNVDGGLCGRKEISKILPCLQFTSEVPSRTNQSPLSTLSCLQLSPLLSENCSDKFSLVETNFYSAKSFHQPPGKKLLCLRSASLENLFAFTRLFMYSKTSFILAKAAGTSKHTYSSPHATVVCVECGFVLIFRL